MRRSRIVGIDPVAPQQGALCDLEDMSLNQKLAVLHDHKEWKCLQKTELRDESKASWESNGLQHIEYDILKVDAMNEITRRILVNVKLNNHWTDNLCSVENVAWGRVASTNSTSCGINYISHVNYSRTN